MSHIHESVQPPGGNPIETDDSQGLSALARLKNRPQAPQ